MNPLLSFTLRLNQVTRICWIELYVVIGSGKCTRDPGVVMEHTLTGLARHLQLFYQNYLRLSPILTMVRLLPSFVTGILCNVLIALLVGRVPVVYLLGK